MRPTIFPAVPRILNRVYDAINNAVKESNWIKRTIFNSAVKSKVERMRKDGHLKHSFYDKIIFSKIREKLGGRIRKMAVGSAPIT